MLETISHLPDRSNYFNRQSGKGFAIYVLDDYAVHLMPEVKEAFLKRGYILVVIGGGITGDIQINDTHLHAPLKAKYRELEVKLMLEKLKTDKEKIATSDRDDMMVLLCNAMKTMKFDKEKAFKSLFLTNSLDGQEDYMVSAKLFQLIGKEIQDFRKKLLSRNCPKSLSELLKTITPPEGIRRKNTEGTELMDCEGEELDLEELEKELEAMDKEAEIKAAEKSSPWLPKNLQLLKLYHCQISAVMLIFKKMQNLLTIYTIYWKALIPPVYWALMCLSLELYMIMLEGVSENELHFFVQEINLKLMNL